MIEESAFGSVSLTNGSGSGRPKNIRLLRIRIRNTGFIKAARSAAVYYDHDVTIIVCCSVVDPDPGRIRNFLQDPDPEYIVSDPDPANT